MVKARIVAEGQNGVFKLESNHTYCLTQKFSSSLAGYNGGTEDKALERPQSHAFNKPYKVKMSEYIHITPVDTMAESIGK